MSKPSHLIALDALVLALQEAPELIEDAQRIGYLRGLPHEGLVPLQPRMVCEQQFKPRATALEAAGFKLVDQLEGPFDVVMLMPERQRDRTMADFVRGFDLLRDDGVLIVSLHNDWGAKRFEGYFAELAGEVENITRKHCRVFWARKGELVDEGLLDEWRHLADLQRILDGQFWSQPGLFGWDRIDEGSAMLVSLLPEDIHGTVADLGSGWGFLSQYLLSHYPDIRSLDAFEADRAGVEATRRNMGNVKCTARARAYWQDVTQGIPDRHYDLIVMNPPFHDGRESDPELGMKFIASAARGLKTDGRLWMVANRHLPYEGLLEEVFDDITMVKQDMGFKVISAGYPRHDLFFRRKRGHR